jgi:DNA-binding MarR family transcriptional regulator
MLPNSKATLGQPCSRGGESVSKKEDLEAMAEPPPTLHGDDLLLQINLRLKLDEVADVDAKVLRAKPLGAPGKRELCQLACRIYDARRAREKLIDSELLGEPAWDMLLALYCLPARGHMMTVTALSYSSGVAQTTALRWQEILRAEGLIERGPQGVDLRKRILRLTPKGRALMEAYLTRLYNADTPIPPHPDLAGG